MNLIEEVSPSPGRPDVSCREACKSGSVVPGAPSTRRRLPPGRPHGRSRAHRRASQTRPCGFTLLPRDDVLAQVHAVEEQRRAGAACPSMEFPSRSRTTSTSPAVLPRPAARRSSTCREQTASVVARLLAAGAILVGKTNLDQFATGLAGDRSPYGVLPQRLRRKVHLRAAPVPGRRWRWRPAWSVSLWARTRRDRDACRPGATTSSASSQRLACSTPTASFPPAGRWTASRSSPSPPTTPCASARSVAAHRGPTPAPPERPAANVTFAVPRAADLEFYGDGEQRDFVRPHGTPPGGDGLAAARVRPGAPSAKSPSLLYDGPVGRRTPGGPASVPRRPRRQGPPGHPRPYRRGRTLQRGGFVRGRLPVGSAPPGLPAGVRAGRGAGRPDHAGAADPRRRARRLDRLGPATGPLHQFRQPPAPRRRGRPRRFHAARPAGRRHPDRTGRQRPAAVRIGGGLAAIARTCRWARPAIRSPSPPASVPVAGAAAGARAPGRRRRRLARPAASPGTAPRRRGLRAFLPHRAPLSLRRPHGPVPSPARPGAAGRAGAAIAVEVYDLPLAGFGAVVNAVAPPLAIGTVELEDGEAIKGYLCEGWAAARARDITEFGGWAAFRDHLEQTRPAHRPGRPIVRDLSGNC